MMDFNLEYEFTKLNNTISGNSRTNSLKSYCLSNYAINMNALKNYCPNNYNIYVDALRKCYYSNNYLGSKKNYLLYVLQLTKNFPIVETYLKVLLNQFSITELVERHCCGYSIWHEIIIKANTISLNSFEMLINTGLNVYDLSISPQHILHDLFPLSEVNFSHYVDIVLLFVRYGTNINVINYEGDTILDRITRIFNPDDEIKGHIMTLMDSGAKTKNPFRTITNEFIKFYSCSMVKLAIKN